METLLLTTFDLAHSREHPMMQRFESGQDVLLQGSRRIVPDSHAQRDALAAGLPVVTLEDQHVGDLILGQAPTLRTEAGEWVQVRVMTADELLAKNDEARRAMIGMAGCLPPPMTRAQAEELTRSLR